MRLTKLLYSINSIVLGSIVNAVNKWVVRIKHNFNIMARYVYLVVFAKWRVATLRQRFQQHTNYVTHTSCLPCNGIENDTITTALLFILRNASTTCNANPPVLTSS